MSKLKPQLIVTGSNKKKGSFASGVGYFIVLILVFALGVYVGMRVESTDINVDEINEVSKELPSTPEKEMEDTAVDIADESDRSSDVENVRSEIAIQNDAETNENLVAKEIDKNSMLDEDSTSNTDGSMISNTIDSGNGLENNLSYLPADSTGQSVVQEDSYRLQVAAFAYIDSANEVVETLKQKGYNAYIVTTSNSRGEVWNLIKIGNFKTPQEAWNYSKIYQQNEGGEVIVEGINEGRLKPEFSEEANSE